MDEEALEDINDVLENVNITVDYAIDQNMTDAQLKNLLGIIKNLPEGEFGEFLVDDTLKEELESYILVELYSRRKRRQNIRTENKKFAKNVSYVMKHGKHVKDLRIDPRLTRFITEFAIEKVEGGKSKRKRHNKKKKTRKIRRRKH